MKKPEKKSKKPTPKPSAASARTSRSVPRKAVAGRAAVSVAQIDPFIKREERHSPGQPNGLAGPAGVPASESRHQRELPHSYGDNEIRLMVRDPNWLFTYWEVRDDVERGAFAQLGGDRGAVTSILRVYDVTDGAAGTFDITLQNMARQWYIEVGANHSYFVEIGLLHRDGRFIALARSNRVTTPRDGMSDVLDEEWMGIDFDRVYALSGGFQAGLSSAELKKLMQQRLQNSISSGSGSGVISSLSSPGRVEQKRKFWFNLDCELIVYGATEPDATVTINGQPIQLRPDGTFTLRYALPDGRVLVDAHAHSADGVEERAIIPNVVRHTSRPDPVFKNLNGKKA